MELNMAKVVVNYDTDTKKLTISVDGGAEQEIKSFNAYSEGNGEETYGYMEARYPKSKENGVNYMLTAHASEIKKETEISNYISQTLKKHQK